MDGEGRDETLRASVLRPLTEWGRGTWIVLAVLGLISLGATVVYGRQIVLGLGVTGMNRPVFWGVYITSFVYFIGLAHAGTLISAILRIVGADWRRPFTRAAEAITVFSLPFGAGCILIDLGRIDRALNILWYGRFESAILWDFTAVGTYLLSSCFFWYIAMVPDIALARDRLTDIAPWRKRLYRILALGWKGTHEEFRRLEKIMGGMAIFLFALVVTVHTVVSWIFGMTLQPGWHTALIGPYFLLGAIYSGVAAVGVVAIILRKVYHWEAYITPKHLDNLGKFLLSLTCFWFYFTFAEFLTDIYGGETAHINVVISKIYQEFGSTFFVMFACCFVIPFIILALKRFRTITGMFVAGIIINVGMWLERWTILIPTMSRPRLPFGPGHYVPTLTEWLILGGCFAGLGILYVLFTRLLPTLPIWEIEEGRVLQARRGRQALGAADAAAAGAEPVPQPASGGGE